MAYADKLIEGSRRVPIGKVIEKFSRFNVPQSSISRMKKLHEEFSSFLRDLDVNGNAS